MRIVRLAAAAALSAALAGPAAGCPLFVDAVNGNDANPGTPAAPLATVQRALQLVPAGTDCRIEVAAGTYAGGWDIAPGIEIAGVGADLVTVEVAPSSIGVRFVGDDLPSSAYARLSGMTFSGTGPGANWLDARSDANRMVFLNVERCRSEALGKAEFTTTGVITNGVKGYFYRCELRDLAIKGWYGGGFCGLQLTLRASLLLRGSLTVSKVPLAGVHQQDGLIWIDESTLVDSTVTLDQISGVSAITARTRVKGSIFAGSGRVYTDNGFGVDQGWFANNDFEPGTSARFRSTVVDTASEFNALTDAEGNVMVDPGFVDRAGEDFHLAPGSACVDAGWRLGRSLDIDGEAQSDGDGDQVSEADIGYDERFVPLLRNLLRDRTLGSISPPDTALADILPLDPARNGYQDDFPSGSPEPEDVLGDATHPLIFYAIEGPGVLKLTVTPDRKVQLNF